MNRMLRASTPIMLFLAAIAVRIVSWHSVFQRDGVYPNGNDAYYHLRRIRYSIDHFPEVLKFDPLINFPAGAQPIWPPTFDWLIAALLRSFPGIDQPGQLELFAVWIPPLLGAATVVLVYFVGHRFYSRSVAILASAALAVLPAHSFYSRLGFVDHHVLVAGLATVMLAIAMRLFCDAAPSNSDRKGNRDGLWLSVGLGFSIAAVVLVWPGSLFHVGVLQIAMIARLVTAAERETAMAWARRFAVVHLVACLAVYPLCAGNEWLLWGSLSPVVLSDFQPLYFFVAFACFGLLCAMWQLGWLASSRLTRAIASGVLGMTVVAGLFSAIPGLGLGVTDALAWFAKEEEFQSVVSESVPLFAGPSGRSRALMFLGRFVYFVPVSIAYLGWQFRHRAEHLLLIWWALAFFVATLMQWRFMNSYSIAHCLLIGIMLKLLHQSLAPRLTNRRRARGAALLATVGVVLVFLPAVRSYGLHLDNVGRSLRGLETPPVGTFLRASFVAGAARFLRDHSSRLEQASYSVLGPWGDGHILKYVAERAVVQDNFGDDVAPLNFRRAEQYFAAGSESQALEVVSPMDTRYVLVRSTGSGQSRQYSDHSQFTRLFRLKGSRGRPTGRAGQRFPVVDALRRHRLVYQSAPLREGGRMPFCMLFEIVAGADLVGRADPGAVIHVSLVVEPRLGSRFEYKARIRASAAGEYKLRLPYSNESFSSDVRTGDHYNLRVGEQSATVIIPESAVLDGTRVDGPALGS